MLFFVCSKVISVLMQSFLLYKKPSTFEQGEGGTAVTDEVSYQNYIQTSLCFDYTIAKIIPLVLKCLYKQIVQQKETLP